MHNPIELAMRVAVIRISGVGFDPEKYARQYGPTPDAIWSSGEPDHLCRIHRDSGLNLMIADADSTSELVQQIRKWVEDNRAAMLAVSDFGGASVIDLGLTVGASDQFTASVRLLPSDLALLAETGVELSVSAYPA
jgi:hypothetical protein